MTEPTISKFSAEGMIGKQMPAFDMNSDSVKMQENGSLFDEETGMELNVYDYMDDGTIDQRSISYIDKETGITYNYHDDNADGIIDRYSETSDDFSYIENQDGSRQYEVEKEASDGKITETYNLTNDGIQTHMTERAFDDGGVFYDINGDGAPDATDYYAALSLVQDIINEERAKLEDESRLSDIIPVDQIPKTTTPPSPDPTATSSPKPTATPDLTPTVDPNPDPTATSSPKPTAKPDPSPDSTPIPDPDPDPTPPCPTNPPVDPGQDNIEAKEPETTPIPDDDCVDKPNTDKEQANIEAEKPEKPASSPGSLGSPASPGSSSTDGSIQNGTTDTEPTLSRRRFFDTHNA